MFFKMSFHSFVPAEPVEDIELGPVKLTILTDERLNLFFNGVALGAEDTIRLPIVDAPLSIRTGKCRYRLTLDGSVELGEGNFTPPQGVGQNVEADFCELEMNDGRYVSVKITDLEFSLAGVTMICIAHSEIEAAAEPASEDPDVDGETDSSE